MKHKRTLGLAAALLVPSIPLGLLGAGTAQAASTTYYVSANGSDSNPGTSPAKPFRTIQKAADRTQPGDTVSVMNGTYQERPNGSDVVAITRSGRPGAPITYRAHPGHRPVINPVEAWNGIRISGASYIAVKGLEIKGDNANLRLADAERSARPGKPKYNTNCVIANRDKKAGKNPHHLEITGNKVHNCPGSGIATINADHVTIDRNHVFSNSWYTVYATSGISVLAAVDSDGGDGRRYKYRITNNTVHDNETKVKWERCNCYSDGNGIIVDKFKGKKQSGEFGPDYRGRTLVANNLTFNNGGSGIHSYHSQHVDIVNNTAYQNGRSPRMKKYANVFAHNSKDVRLLNNVSYARPGQPTNSASKNVDVTYDYNVYYGGRTPEVQGRKDVVADPRFARPGNTVEADFRLTKNSPAAGSGTPFGAVTTDITGAARKAGTPDRGAFALTTGPGTDASDKPLAGVPTPEIGEGGTTGGNTTGGETTGDNTAGEPAAGDKPDAPASGSPAGEADAGEPAQDAATSGADEDKAGAEAQAQGDKPQGGNGPLAATGTTLAPLGAGLAVLALGGGILFLARRRKRA